MCGRLNVMDDPLCEVVCEQLGMEFSTESNTDLRPTEQVACVGWSHSQLQQCNLAWGIKPDWAKRLIINAQAETVAQKPTFAHAFQHHRVIVPCSGWFEWRQEGDHKVKYLFSPAEPNPLYMAAIALENNARLVTLTTQPTEQCAPYHRRMPALIAAPDIRDWLAGSSCHAERLLGQPYDKLLKIR